MGIMFIESSLLADRLPDIAIVAGIVSYVIALLSLTILGSPVFFFGCYIGTVLFVSAILTKMEMFTFMTRRHALFVILVFVSALLITTALVSVFTDIGLRIWVINGVKEIQRTTYFSSRDGRLTGSALAHGCNECQPIYAMEGFTLKILRPWAWIFEPSLIIGIVLFVVAVLLSLRSE